MKHHLNVPCTANITQPSPGVNPAATYFLCTKHDLHSSCQKAAAMAGCTLTMCVLAAVVSLPRGAACEWRDQLSTFEDSGKSSQNWCHLAFHR